MQPAATNAPANLAGTQTLARPPRPAKWLLLIAAALVLISGLVVALWFKGRSEKRPRSTESPVAVSPAPAQNDPAASTASSTNQASAKKAAITDPAVRNAAIAAGEIPAEIRKSGGELIRSAVKRVEPGYPPLAKVARVSGAVVVEVTIDEQGDVIDTQVISGHPLLRNAALKAARGWKFAPDKVYSKPVKVVGPLIFNFNL